jgi:hypothetical protein
VNKAATPRITFNIKMGLLAVTGDTQLTKKKPGRAVPSFSRLLDFASEKELVAQIGNAKDEWPLVVLKKTGARMPGRNLQG